MQKVSRTTTIPGLDPGVHPEVCPRLVTAGWHLTTRAMPQQYEGTDTYKNDMNSRWCFRFASSIVVMLKFQYDGNRWEIHTPYISITEAIRQQSASTGQNMLHCCSGRGYRKEDDKIIYWRWNVPVWIERHRHSVYSSVHMETNIHWQCALLIVLDIRQSIWNTRFAPFADN